MSCDICPKYHRRTSENTSSPTWVNMCNGSVMYGKLVALQREPGRRSVRDALRAGDPNLASSMRSLAYVLAGATQFTHRSKVPSPASRLFCHDPTLQDH